VHLSLFCMEPGVRHHRHHRRLPARDPDRQHLLPRDLEIHPEERMDHRGNDGARQSRGALLPLGGGAGMTHLSKSPWILHYDASSCNGCDIEVLPCLTPLYDVERLGIINTGNPKHADMLVITGGINEQHRAVVKNLFEQMPDPKVVVAVGICACTGGVFRECYNTAGGVDCITPVDV